MSTLATDVHDSAFLTAVEDVLRTRVRAALKGPLMQIAETEVDKAVEDAVAALNVKAKAWRDEMHMREVVEILLRREATKPENTGKTEA